MRASVRGRVLRLDTASVAEIAATVDLGVAVQQLDVSTSFRHTDHIVMSGNRCEVHDHDDKIRGVMGTSNERNDAAFELVDPLESGVVEIHLMQRALFGQRAIEVPHPLLNALVIPVLKKMPVEAFVVAPFAPLRNLTAHEHELLARMAEHVAIEGAQSRALLPDVARHLVEHRALAVHDFVM